jgi:4-amino-4-deoxy-L-arabinose transferase-like glycosyltransferase
VLTRRQQSVAVAVFLVAAVVRLWAIQSELIHDWDESYHALVAKHLAAHPLEPTLYDDAELPHDEHFWPLARIFLNKPPLALWLMAASIRVFGATPAAMRFPSALLDLAAVVLTFALGRRLFGPREALAAMGLHALLGNALLWVGGVHATDHVDVQLAFWVELAVYGVVRQRTGSNRWLWLVGGATGAALLTKSAPGALPLLLLAVYGGKSPRQALGAAAFATALALAVAAPWNLYMRARWPELTALASQAQLSHLWQVWEDHGGHPLFHLEKLGQLHGVFAAIGVGWFLFAAAQAREQGARLIALYWLAPLVLFSFSATKMPGYLGIASPAVCLMLAAFAVDALERTRLSRRLIAAAVIASALLTDFRELRRVGPASADEHAFVAALRALPPRTIVLGVRPAIQAMFHGAHAAYSRRWTPEQRADAERRGYLVRLAACDGEEGLRLPAGYCAP